MLSVRMVILIFLGLGVVPAAQGVVAERPKSLSLDSATIDLCMQSMPEGSYGLLISHCYDSETGQELDSIDIQRIRIGEQKGSHDLWHPERQLWWTPGNGAYWFNRNGYTSVFVDSIRIPVDSAVLVTVVMKKGDGTVRAWVPGDSIASVAIFGLDGIIPGNILKGRILDDASGSPILGASVYCEETDKMQITDGLGQFAFELNILRTVNINAWHPMYDSLRIEVEKNFVRSSKNIEIHFQAQRRAENGQEGGYKNDSTILLLVDFMEGGGFSPPRPYEFSNRIYTYAVAPGDVFGPTSQWTYSGDIPFRFVRQLPDKTAWLQFAQDFQLMTERAISNTNFAFLADSSIELRSKSRDAGATVTISVLPDYSPRGLYRTVIRPRRQRIPDPVRKMEPDSCEVIRAEVEWLFLEDILALMKGDFARLAQSLSDSLYHLENEHGLTHIELVRKAAERHLLKQHLKKRFLDLFDLRLEEMYVYGICAGPPNERFLNICKETGFEPRPGDVFIFLPGCVQQWTAGVCAVYRRENSGWKMVALI